MHAQGHNSLHLNHEHVNDRSNAIYIAGTRQGTCVVAAWRGSPSSLVRCGPYRMARAILPCSLRMVTYRTLWVL